MSITKLAPGLFCMYWKSNFFFTIRVWWWCMTYWSNLRSPDFVHRLISNEALGFRSQLYFSLEINENTECGIPLKKETFSPIGQSPNQDCCRS